MQNTYSLCMMTVIKLTKRMKIWEIFVLGRKGHRVCQYCATDDNHFTVLVWTAAMGKVVMVAVIFFRETLRSEWQSGIDVLRKYFDPDAGMPKDFRNGSNG